MRWPHIAAPAASAANAASEHGGKWMRSPYFCWNGSNCSACGPIPSTSLPITAKCGSSSMNVERTSSIASA